MLGRLRNVSDDQTGSHEAYFKGRKRLMQTVSSRSQLSLLWKRLFKSASFSPTAFDAKDYEWSL
jgi:hypothetical protein